MRNRLGPIKVWREYLHPNQQLLRIARRSDKWTASFPSGLCSLLKLGWVARHLIRNPTVSVSNGATLATLQLQRLDKSDPLTVSISLAANTITVHAESSELASLYATDLLEGIACEKYRIMRQLATYEEAVRKGKRFDLQFYELKRGGSVVMILPITPSKARRLPKRHFLGIDAKPLAYELSAFTALHASSYEEGAHKALQLLRWNYGFPYRQDTVSIIKI